MAFEWLHDSLRQLSGIEPREVHQALAAERRWPRLATDGELGLRVLTIWARTADDRPLVIATRKRSAWAWQCLGAREMSAPELAEFEAWEAAR
ncbi:hypothetical protein LWF15_22120 [Kineosporia rhizophila]|uniref:hypothetical protein n=1 Tax=Kineosporia rhizophila TaxID=84633 RepID=UPI001E42E3EE|nr:hypothetical protein [Kineosporia rhizophila]MCE0538198.1 hypothetical protein [Kineosporia rhizophila]